MNSAEHPFIRLRVLVEFDSVYNVFVGRCLETGDVVTADDLETASEMMEELLEDAVSYAIEHGTITNLCSTPASLDVWKRWQEVVRTQEPREVRKLIDARPLCLADPEVSAEIQVARAA